MKSEKRIKEEREKFLSLPWKLRNDYIKGIIDALMWVLMDEWEGFEKPSKVKD